MDVVIQTPRRTVELSGVEYFDYRKGYNADKESLRVFFGPPESDDSTYNSYDGDSRIVEATA